MKNSSKLKGRKGESRRPERTRAQQLATFLCPAIVALAAFTAFLPALDAEFVAWDDLKLLVENREYRGLGDAHVQWMFTTTYLGHYQPLTWFSYAIDHQIFGLSARAYHRTNLILHALNAVLVYLAAIRLLAIAQRLQPEQHPIGLRVAAAVAALFFAVHPLRVESVAWATERRDLLSLFFLLLTLLAYLRAFAANRVETRARAWYIGSCVLLLCSVLSKAWGMSFVVVVVILDVWPLRRLPQNLAAWWRPPHRPVWLQKLPYLALGLATAAMAAYAQQTGSIGTVKTLDEWSVTARLAQAAYGLTFYVWKTIWPLRLAALYELPYEMDPLAPPYLSAYLALAGSIVLLIALRPRWPALPIVALIYAIILAPVLGFTQAGPQLVADKYSYLSCLGWSLLAGGGLLWLWRRRAFDVWGKAVAVGVLVVLIALFVLTRRQTKTWYDTQTLWTHAIDVGYPSAAAHSRLGTLLRKEGRFDEAIAHLRAALQLYPDYGYAWLNLGNAHFQTDNLDEAERCYREALKYVYDKHAAYDNLGQLYYRQRRLDDAIATFRAGVEYVTNYPAAFSSEPFLYLGAALRAKGDLDEARRMLETAARYARTRDRALAELDALQRAQRGRP